MTTTATLADVKRYWSTHVNDIEVIQAPIGSAEFLDELIRYRYEKMPYLRDIVTSARFTASTFWKLAAVREWTWFTSHRSVVE